MHLHSKQYLQRGVALSEAKKAMIMIHGRNGQAENILALTEQLSANDTAFFAPEANQNTWYPYSFMASREDNEPSLSSAIELIEEVVQDIHQAGFDYSQIYLLGFSQGACLAGEYVVQNPRKYGGLYMLSGGLIGKELMNQEAYGSGLDGMPVFIGCSDIDAHVPVERVRESTQILETMGANVMEKIYKGMGHIINEDEIKHINKIIENGNIQI
jgi:predicted esterase